MCLEFLFTGFREAVGRLWRAIDELFFDGDTFGVLHLLEVPAEVSTSDIQLLREIGEVRFTVRIQMSEDPEPGRLVNELVELHYHTLVSTRYDPIP